jgi:hypothetical protein
MVISIRKVFEIFGRDHQLIFLKRIMVKIHAAYRHGFLLGLFLIALAPMEAHSQATSGSHGFRYDGHSSTPLAIGAIGQTRRDLLTYGVAAGIGGISLSAMARPGPDIDNQAIHLAYDQRRPDGSRLVVSMGGNIVSAAIYDWQLNPIALFADSVHTTVLSIYGDGPDPYRYYYIRYHPAFLNTLLGLRLLQAEILLMDTYAFWPLPEIDGQIPLGNGEVLPDQGTPHEAILALSKAMRKTRFRSWVLTDAGNRAYLHGVNPIKGLVLDNPPYYLFWSIPKKIERRLSSRRELLEQLQIEQLEFNDLIAVYNGAVEDYNSGRDPSARPGLYARVKELQTEIDKKQKDLDQAEARLTALNNEMGVLPVEEVSRLTRGVAQRTGHIRSLNPAVWDSLVITAEYAAFFRYVKESNPNNWKAFVRDVSKASPVALKTPTHMERPKR